MMPPQILLEIVLVNCQYPQEDLNGLKNIQIIESWYYAVMEDGF